MDSRQYENIGAGEVEIILDALQKDGCTIKGENPWTVRTAMFDVVLEGSWDEGSNVLTITLIRRPSFIPGSVVWGRINTLLAKLDGA